VYRGDDGTFLQTVAGDGMYFKAIDAQYRRRLDRVDVRTGAVRTVYRVPKSLDAFGIYQAKVGGGRAGIELINENNYDGVRIVAVPTAGGKPRIVAKATHKKPCWDDVGLVGVTPGGEVVTDELRCQKPGKDDEPGTLFAYGPGGDRRAFGHRFVPEPERLRYDADVWVVGDRWLTLDEGLNDSGPDQLFLTEAATDEGRRLVKDRSIKASDLNENGDVIVALRRPHAHPKRPFRVLLFPHGGGASREVASTPEFPTVRLCGRGLAVLEWRHDRTAQRLTFRDTPDAPPRTIFSRPRPHGFLGIQDVACTARWFGYSTLVRGGVTLNVSSLAP
jgi:hypothetical protein